MVLAELGYEVVPLSGVVDAVVAHVPREVPLSVTVTAHRGQDATTDLAIDLAGRGYDVSPHLSARLIGDAQHLGRTVSRCRDAGIRGVFVVGGDRRPGDPGEVAFRDALHLLRHLHEAGNPFDRVGIAGHPEGHPDVGRDALFAVMREKAALATYVTTQMVFDPAVIVDWSQELLAEGIDLPVRVGVPGVVALPKLLRVSAQLGLGASATFLRRQPGIIRRVLQPHGFRPDSIVDALLPQFGGAGHRLSGLHVFTFNDLAPTEAWRRKRLSRCPAPRRPVGSRLPARPGPEPRRPAG